MPLYNNTTAGPVRALYPGETVTVFNAETVTTGQRSQQINISPKPNATPSLSVMIAFSAAPGAFEIDVQQADDDSSAANYISVPVGAVVTSVDATNLNARVDLSPFLGKFISLLMKTQPAVSVKVTAQVSAQ